MKRSQLLPFLLWATACSTSIQLGTPDARVDGAEMMGVPPAIDAGSMIFDGGPMDVDPDAGMDATIDAEPDDGLCGFRYEQEAPRQYSHVWGQSPTDLWVVEEQRRVLHWNGSELEDRPLPEGTTGYILELSGPPGGQPWVSLTGNTETLYRWDGDTWQVVALPSPLFNPHVEPLAPDNIWVYGNRASRAKLFQYDGADWREIEFTPDRYNALSAYDDSRVLLQTRSADLQVNQFFVGDATGTLQEIEPPAGYPTFGSLWHRQTESGELWLSDDGIVWDGTDWWDEWRRPSWSLHEAADYAGSIWLVRSDGMLEIDDVADLSSATFHATPEGTSIRGGVVPESGPPFVVGAGIHYWDGVRWQSQVPYEPPLFGSVRGLWGSSANDYWLWNLAGPALHLHNGISEQQFGPSDCISGGSLVSHVHALGTNLVAFTCHGLQRLQDGVFGDVLIPTVDDLGRKSRVWGSRDAVYAFVDNAVHRYDGSEFLVERSGVFDEDVVGDISPIRPPLMEGNSAGEVYLYARSARSVPNALFARRDGTWDWTPSFDLGDNQAPTGMHVEPDGRVWLAGSGRIWEEETRVWSFDGSGWTTEDLSQPPNPSSSTRRFIDGRDGQLWLVSSEREIWRQVDGEWRRDDRCVDAPRLQNARFEGLWFPADGPPKVFVAGGGVLVWEEGPE